MHPAKQTAKLQPLFIIIFIKTATTAFGENGKGKWFRATQRCTVLKPKRDNNRYFLFRKIKQKGMLIQNTCLWPAAGAIKLYNQPCTIFLFKLIDPVNVAVQRPEKICAADSQSIFNEPQDPIRAKIIKSPSFFPFCIFHTFHYEIFLLECLSLALNISNRLLWKPLVIWCGKPDQYNARHDPHYKQISPSAGREPGLLPEMQNNTQDREQ